MSVSVKRLTLIHSILVQCVESIISILLKKSDLYSLRTTELFDNIFERCYDVASSVIKSIQQCSDMVCPHGSNNNLFAQLHKSSEPKPTRKSNVCSCLLCLIQLSNAIINTNNLGLSSLNIKIHLSGGENYDLVSPQHLIMQRR